MSPRVKFHKPKLTGLMVLTVIQVILALTLTIILSMRVGKYISKDDPTTTITTTMATTAIPLNTTSKMESDNEDMGYDAMNTSERPVCTDDPQMLVNILRPYYFMCICISTGFLVLPVLLGLGIKSKTKSLFKSHTDVDLALTVFSFIIYILTLTDGGSRDKDFSVIMGIFIILRFFGIFLATLHLNEIEVADIRDLPTAHYRASVVVDPTPVTVETF